MLPLIPPPPAPVEIATIAQPKVSDRSGSPILQAKAIAEGNATSSTPDPHQKISPLTALENPAAPPPLVEVYYADPKSVPATPAGNPESVAGEDASLLGSPISVGENSSPPSDGQSLHPEKT